MKRILRTGRGVKGSGTLYTSVGAQKTLEKEKGTQVLNLTPLALFKIAVNEGNTLIRTNTNNQTSSIPLPRQAVLNPPALFLLGQSR